MELWGYSLCSVGGKRSLLHLIFVISNISPTFNTFLACLIKNEMAWKISVLCLKFAIDCGDIADLMFSVALRSVCEL